MSLLQSLSYKDYQIALLLSEDQCGLLAELANLRHIKFEGSKKPGELLLKILDRKGFTLQQYKKLITSHFNKKSITYRPNVKLAILIGNENYVYLPKLATPSNDCASISKRLKSLGFNVITLKDVTKTVLLTVLGRIFGAVPEDSYCVIFYAGHGCELDSDICFLGVECPSDGIELDHCVTQNQVLQEVANCSPELTVLIMDMCRIHLDSKQTDTQTQPNMQSQSHKNLFLCYSTQSSSIAYEKLQINCSQTIDNNLTYELKPSDLVNVVPGTSQYVNALCEHLYDDADVDCMLERVHEDVGHATKSQKPVKIKYGEAKRSMHDPAKGDVKQLYAKLQEIGKEFNEVFSS